MPNLNRRISHIFIEDPINSRPGAFFLRRTCVFNLSKGRTGGTREGLSESPNLQYGVKRFMLGARTLETTLRDGAKRRDIDITQEEMREPSHRRVFGPPLTQLHRDVLADVGM